MSATAADRAKQRLYARRWAVFMYPVWISLGVLNIHRIVVGDGNWWTGLLLALDIGLAFVNANTLWTKEASR